MWRPEYCPGKDLGAEQWDKQDVLEVAATPSICLYATMLGLSDAPAVAAYLRRQAGRFGMSPESLLASLRDLWAGKTIRSDLVCAIHEGFEDFAIENGSDPAASLSQMTAFIQSSSVFLPDYLLKTLRDLIPALLSAEDPHFELADAISKLTSLSLPSARSWSARGAGPRNGSDRSFQVFFLPDRRLRAPFFYDCDFFSSPYLKPFPRVFNLPAFTELRICADQRPLQAIVHPERLRRAGDVIFLDGTPFGHIIDFGGWLSARGQEAEGGRFKAWKAVLADRDWYCPVRRRVVLRAGCSYGAPLYAMEFNYRLEASRPACSLSLAAMALDEDFAPDRNPDLCRKHCGVLASLSAPTIFRYQRATDSALIDGKPFARGTQARIMDAILMEWNRTGRTRFDYRSLKFNVSIFSNPKTTGFEIHFARLRKKLERLGSRLIFQTTAPGEFQVSADGAWDVQSDAPNRQDSAGNELNRPRSGTPRGRRPQVPENRPPIVPGGGGAS